MFYTSMSVVPKLVMQHWARSREAAGHGQSPVLGHGVFQTGREEGLQPSCLPGRFRLAMAKAVSVLSRVPSPRPGRRSAVDIVQYMCSVFWKWGKLNV